MTKEELGQLFLESELEKVRDIVLENPHTVRFAIERIKNEVVLPALDRMTIEAGFELDAMYLAVCIQNIMYRAIWRALAASNNT